MLSSKGWLASFLKGTNYLMKTLYVALKLDDPTVAWEVYRGNMISCESIKNRTFQPISFWYVKYLKQCLRVAPTSINETLLERVRESEFPEETSRLKGLYFFENKDDAQKILAFWGMENHTLIEAYYEHVTKVTRVDSKWITNYLSKVSDTKWMRKYWSGEPYNAEPHWELLVKGKLVITDSNAIEKSYETVKRLWPRSLPLLELSRISALIGSELGHCAPIILKLSENNFGLRYIINMEDAKNDEFLERLKGYMTLNNIPPLVRSDTELVTPDLRKADFDFSIDTNGWIKQP